jgi:hypothetical protein
MILRWQVSFIASMTPFGYSENNEKKIRKTKILIFYSMRALIFAYASDALSSKKSNSFILD